MEKYKACPGDIVVIKTRDDIKAAIAAGEAYELSSPGGTGGAHTPSGAYMTRSMLDTLGGYKAIVKKTLPSSSYDIVLEDFDGTQLPYSWSSDMVKPVYTAPLPEWEEIFKGDNNGP